MSGQHRITVSRVYDTDPDDGERVLVDRLWPRGFRKGDPRVGRWIREVAPSTELRKWYSHQPERFDEFASRYAAELQAPEGAAALRNCATWSGPVPSRSSPRPAISTAVTSPSWPGCSRRLRAVSPASAVAVAVVFVWLGMVVAISFIEAPLKFRAPGVTLQIGLGIGRLVFRALNGCELLLAAVLAVRSSSSRRRRRGGGGGRRRAHAPGPGADRATAVDQAVRRGARRWLRTAVTRPLGLRRPRARQGGGAADRGCSAALG